MPQFDDDAMAVRTKATGSELRRRKYCTQTNREITNLGDIEIPVPSVAFKVICNLRCYRRKMRAMRVATFQSAWTVSALASVSKYSRIVAIEFLSTHEIAQDRELAFCLMLRRE